MKTGNTLVRARNTTKYASRLQNYLYTLLLQVAPRSLLLPNQFTSFPVLRNIFLLPNRRYSLRLFYRNFLLISIRLPLHTVADPFSHPAPISFSRIFFFPFGILPPSNSAAILPTLVCTSASPPQKRFGGVSRDKVHVHRCTCPPATRSVRDSRLLMTQLRLGCGRSIKQYPYYRIEFFAVSIARHPRVHLE